MAPSKLVLWVRIKGVNFAQPKEGKLTQVQSKNYFTRKSVFCWMCNTVLQKCGHTIDAADLLCSRASLYPYTSSVFHYYQRLAPGKVFARMKIIDYL